MYDKFIPGIITDSIKYLSLTEIQVRHAIEAETAKNLDVQGIVIENV